MSVLDPIAVALAAGSAGRPVRFMALSELFEHGVVGWTLRVTRQVPLRRGLGDWDAIENVADVVRSGSRRINVAKRRVPRRVAHEVRCTSSSH